MPKLDLHDQLQRLYELQQIDLEIIALYQQFKQVPARIEKLDSSFHVHEQKLAEKQQKLAEAEKAQRSKTGEIEMLNEQALKYQAQLRGVKTNKEYQALDKEISYLDDKKAQIEDEILSYMEATDRLKTELHTQEKAFETEKAKHDEQKAEHKQVAASLGSQIKALQSRRQAASVGISAELLKQYQLKLKRQRTGLVSLVENGVCTNCHMAVPPQTLQETRQYEKPITCRSCRSVLYIPH